jgi:putative phosphoserine phosphatase/1-acylglycerol-3-phosphate O-acyltransferase
VTPPPTKERAPPASRIAAIFDLDDTVLAGSSGKMMIRYLHQTRQLTRYFRRRDIARTLALVAGWQMGLVDPFRAMEQTARLSAGMDVEEMWALVRRWFESMVVHAILPQARNRLEWHRSQGHIPVICSASSQFSVIPVAEHLGIEHTIYTELLSDNGRLTGALRTPIVYGPGKVEWMTRWSAAHAVDLAACYFYSDHVSDAALLDLVAHPHAVNPHGALRKLALQRGWPVLDWHQP